MNLLILIISITVLLIFIVKNKFIRFEYFTEKPIADLNQQEINQVVALRGGNSIKGDDLINIYDAKKVEVNNEVYENELGDKCFINARGHNTNEYGVSDCGKVEKDLVNIRGGNTDLVVGNYDNDFNIKNVFYNFS